MGATVRIVAGWLIAVAVIALSALLTAALFGGHDEAPEHPDVSLIAPLATTTVTVPPFADCSGDSPVDPCVIPDTAPTTTAPPAPPPAAPPVTCGPDVDEQHPPPCD